MTLRLPLIAAGVLNGSVKNLGSGGGYLINTTYAACLRAGRKSNAVQSTFSTGVTLLHGAAQWRPEPARRRRLLPDLTSNIPLAVGTAARLGVVTSSGLIRSEAMLVLAGVRHETVPAYATYYAARRRTMLRPPILRQSP